MLSRLSVGLSRLCELSADTLGPVLHAIYKLSTAVLSRLSVGLSRLCLRSNSACILNSCSSYEDCLGESVCGLNWHCL